MFVGGGLGSVSRYGLAGMAQHLFRSRFPLGTLLANVIGCLIIGALAYLVVDRPTLTPQHRLLLMTGFLGGLTTFSTFGYETFGFARENQVLWAGANIVVNVLLSLGAVWAGWATAKAILG